MVLVYLDTTGQPQDRYRIPATATSVEVCHRPPAAHAPPIHGTALDITWHGAPNVISHAIVTAARTANNRLALTLTNANGHRIDEVINTDATQVIVLEYHPP